MLCRGVWFSRDRYLFANVQYGFANVLCICSLTDLFCLNFDCFVHYFRYLYNNKLTKIPDGGDFQDKSVGALLLNNNRITKIGSNTFKKFSTSSL